ncbi:MAG: 16S rRNA (adenine(1518)-N(6)/adenine(1519)-N(6))-dimethyltransferase RsmA [bacterium]|nr:16S rRNA (adenine(1518)-N(6)/adenine(1519)-N(6))-dimethyltransferase RsmA [bacterium]
MYAKKSLGQHFLHSDADLKAMVNAGEVNADDVVLEIGPGKGDLTKKLLFFAAKVIAVEKDDELYEFLKEKFAEEIKAGKLDLIHGDIMDFDLGSSLGRLTSKSEYKIVANIPYNITGGILRKFLSAKLIPERIAILLQKEVAERVVARDKKESILSLSIKAYGKPSYFKTVKAGSFSPPPKVDSGILIIEDTSKDFFKDFSEEDFFRVVKTGFKSKRKKLSSNLAEIYGKKEILQIFSDLNLDPNLRAEDADINIWKKLVSRL